MQQNDITIEYDRPKLTGYQTDIIDAKERYTITEASTKAGKTVSHIVWIYEQSLQGKEGQNFWWVAPVYQQAEIAYRRLKHFIPHKELFTANDSKLTIKLINGAVIYFKSAEKPDNLYGEDVYGVVIDEFTRIREDSWFAVRSTITATRAKCKLIGNVKGITNWGYEIARKVESGELKDWKYFKITADDAVKAGILSKDEIEDARRTYPKGKFLELYYGIPNQNASDKFCYSFDDEFHIAKCKLNRNYPVYLSFDFNYNPICCSVIQHYDGCIYILEVIKLENSNIYSLCKAIATKYPDCQFMVTGDRSGKANSALVKDNLNYYKIIKTELLLGDRQFVGIMGANPNIEQNQVLVNAILEHYDVNIDPDKASALIFDCKFVRIGPDNKIIKTDRSDTTQQADALDTFRYYLNTFHKDFVSIPKY